MQCKILYMIYDCKWHLYFISLFWVKDENFLREFVWNICSTKGFSEFPLLDSRMVGHLGFSDCASPSGSRSFQIIYEVPFNKPSIIIVLYFAMHDQTYSHINLRVRVYYNLDGSLNGLCSCTAEATSISLRLGDF